MKIFWRQKFGKVAVLRRRVVSAHGRQGTVSMILLVILASVLSMKQRMRMEHFRNFAKIAVFDILPLQEG